MPQEAGIHLQAVSGGVGRRQQHAARPCRHGRCSSGAAAPHQHAAGAAWQASPASWRQRVQGEPAAGSGCRFCCQGRAKALRQRRQRRRHGWVSRPHRLHAAVAPGHAAALAAAGGTSAVVCFQGPCNLVGILLGKNQQREDGAEAFADGSGTSRPLQATARQHNNPHNNRSGSRDCAAMRNGQSVHVPYAASPILGHPPQRTAALPTGAAAPAAAAAPARLPPTADAPPPPGSPPPPPAPAWAPPAPAPARSTAGPPPAARVACAAGRQSRRRPGRRPPLPPRRGWGPPPSCPGRAARWQPHPQVPGRGTRRQRRRRRRREPEQAGGGHQARAWARQRQQGHLPVGRALPVCGSGGILSLRWHARRAWAAAAACPRPRAAHLPALAIEKGEQ